MIVAPLTAATFIGVMSGQPLIVIYPAVIPVAFIAGSPFSLIGALLFIGIGINQLKRNIAASFFKQWAIKYLILGVVYGFISSVSLWIFLGDGNTENLLVGIKYLALNLMFTSIVISLVLAKIWHTYSLKNIV